MVLIPQTTTSIGILTGLLAIVVYVAGDIMGLFSRNKFNVNGRTVLLTGGSSGMGRALAKQLAQRGANVVIVARGKANLDATLNEMAAAAKTPSQRFHTISADVTLPEENERILAETTAWNSGFAPDVVWACAGSAHPGLFADTPIPLLRSQMDMNYWAAAYLSHSALNLFLGRRGPVKSQHANEPRHIVMTSSVVALMGLAGYGPYCPAKAAMRNLADTLHNEVQLYNGARRRSGGGAAQVPDREIKIHIVVPGTILSPGFEEEEKVKHPVTKVLEAADPKQTPDQVAAAALAGLDSGDFLIATQWLGKLMRIATLGGSPRDNIIVDTVGSWVTSIAMLFIMPDLHGKVFKYGKQNGLDQPQPAVSK